MTPPRRIMTSRDWLHLWLRTAAMGTVVLVVVFVGYQIVERELLLGHASVELLFALHMARGIGASVMVGTVTVVGIWAARRRYDAAFEEAYRRVELSAAERSVALERAQAFSEALFDALRDRLLVIDERGDVVKANRVALEGAGDGDLVGQPCSLLGAACSPSGEACVAMRAHRTRLPVIGECVRADPRTGRIYAIDAYPVPDLGAGGPLVIESARDVTEAKQLEAHVRYQEKLAALGVLSAGIAHDIANPLASLSSELELLELEEDPTRTRASLQVLRKHVQRITRTLREMSDFARRRGEELATLRLDVAVDDALRMVRHDPRARRVTFDVDVPPTLPPIRMVEDHLVMVLVNLLINAFDAMPDGGSVALRGVVDEGQVVLQVADTGTGMPDAIARRATEPLFTTKPGGHGTGLGLSVCEDVLRSAGGALSLASAPGRGTTVTLRFGAPVAEGADPGASTHA